MDMIYGRRMIGNVLLSVTLSAMAGCDSGRMTGMHQETGAPTQAESALMNSRIDESRGRLWVLTTEGVDLYESRQRRKLAHFDIPNWIWARQPYACPPDLALSPTGEVLITSNVVPTVWRLDPSIPVITRHELVLMDTPGQEFGFTSLEYSKAQEAFIGVSSVGGSVWRVDSLLREASRMPEAQALSKACGSKAG